MCKGLRSFKALLSASVKSMCFRETSSGSDSGSVCVALGRTEQPHDAAEFEPGGTLQHNTQPRESKERGANRIWGAQGSALHVCLISKEMHLAISVEL